MRVLLAQNKALILACGAIPSRKLTDSEGPCTLRNAKPSGQQAPNIASRPQTGIFIPSSLNAPDI